MSDMAFRQKKIFDAFFNRIKTSVKMSPKKVSSFLEDITQNIRSKDIRGTPLSAHLSELKTAVLDALPDEWNKPTGEFLEPLGWDIKGTRAEYKAAKTLQKSMSKFTSSDTPLAWLQKAINNGGKKVKEIAEAAKHIPELNEAITEFPKGMAGAALAPKIGSLPRTGLLGALAAGVTKATGAAASGNIALPATVALGMLGSSPRYAAEALSAGRREIPEILKNIMSKTKIATKAAPALANLKNSKYLFNNQAKKYAKTLEEMYKNNSKDKQ